MKILVIDDHQLFCDGLVMLLGQMPEQPDILTAGRSETGLTMVEDNPDLDLVILDINLPDRDGFETLKLLSSIAVVPVVMLTASENRHDMIRGVDLGARAYVLKSSVSSVLMSAIQMVLAGEIYVPASIAIANHSGRLKKNNQSAAQSLNGLTDRQEQVLGQLRDGVSNKEIARRLDISEATVKVHVSGILTALGVRSRPEAVLKAEKLDKNSGSL